MTTLFTTDITYSAADTCGVQVGRVSCTGVPLLQPSGGDTRLWNGLVSYEYNETLTPGRRDIDANGAGMNMSSRTIDDQIDGYTALIRQTGKIHPGLLAQWGVADPVYSDDGAIIGTKGFRASAACRCGGSDCTNGGFYMLLWARAFGCADNEEIFDEDGLAVYEITIFPWIERFVPTGGARRGANVGDGRRDLRATLKPNPNFFYGPGYTDPTAEGLYPRQPDDTDDLDPIGLIEPYAQYLTTVPYPGACACENHGAPWGVADTPIPVGEDGYTFPAAA